MKNRLRFRPLPPRWQRRLAALVGVILALVAGSVVWAQARAPYETYKDIARDLQTRLASAYTTRHGYPTGAAAAALLDCRAPNPFAKGTVHQLAAGAAPQPGCFDYVVLVSTRGTPKDPGTAQFRWLTAGADPLRLDELAVHYALIFYGPNPKPYLRDIASREFARAGLAGHCLSQGGGCLDTLPPGVDWERVTYVLTSISGQWEFL